MYFKVLTTAASIHLTQYQTISFQTSFMKLILEYAYECDINHSIIKSFWTL